jgi:hypothetical protein
VRLTRLDIRGFGPLRGSYPLEVGDGGVALLLERNEAGKSTLTAAVLAALFGLPNDRRRAGGKLTEREVFRPWDHEDYGLTLYLEADGHELAIDRDFERDSVRVLAGGEDVTDRYQQGSRIGVGEELTGLSREQFTLSTFVGQGDLIWNDAGGLTEALQRVADTQSGRTTAAAAIAVLEETLANYQGLTIKSKGRVETEIKRCQQRVEEDRRTLDQLEARRAELSAAIEAVSRRAEAQELRARRRGAIRYRRLCTEQQELRTRLREDDQLRHRMVETEGRVQAETEILDLVPQHVHALEGSVRFLESERRLAEEAEAEADQAAAERAEASDGRDALHLSRRPTDEDRDVLVTAHTRIQDARRYRGQLENELAHEVTELLRRGFELDRALALARSFEDLADPDREILVDHTRNAMRHQDSRQTLDEEIAHAKRRRAEIRQGQQQRKHTGIWCMIVGTLPILVGLSMHAILRFDALWLHGPGALLVAAGIVIYAGGTRFGKREDLEAKQRLTRLRETLAGVDAEEAAEVRRWEDLARRLGLDPRDLSNRYQEFRIVDRPADTVRRVRDRIAETMRAEAEAVASLAEVWTLFGDAPDAEDLDTRIAVVQRGLDAFREADRAAAASDRARRKAEEAWAAVQKQARRVDERLAACGVVRAGGESIDEAMEKVRERAERAREARRVRDKELPELKSRLLDPTQIQQFERRIADLGREMAELRADADEAGAAQVGWVEAESVLSQEEYDRAIVELDAADARDRADDENQRTEVRAFLAHYEATAPPLRESIDQHELALRQAVEFREAVELARDTLIDIARQTHRDWAEAINPHANEILQAIGSRVRELSFDEQLRLRLKHGRRLLSGTEAQQQLSAGAIDGVYLAARIAISRFLSGGTEVLPLILDDPFANADDSRLVAGLEVLLSGIAPRQQVLLMACQHSRYAWARAQLGYPDKLVLLQVTQDQRAEAEGGDAASP